MILKEAFEELDRINDSIVNSETTEKEFRLSDFNQTCGDSTTNKNYTWLHCSGIYEYINDNGHKYVGQAKDLYERLRQHTRAITNMSSGEYYSPLHEAIRKYGDDKFTIKILELCDIAELNDREKDWIREERTYVDPEHYNRTEGGDALSIDYIKNCGLYNKELGEFDYGKLEQIRQDIKAGLPKRAIARKYFDQTKTDAYNDANDKKREPAGFTVVKKINNCKGCYKLTDAEKETYSNPIDGGSKNGLSIAESKQVVLQYSMDGKLIKVYDSMKQASAATGLTLSGINRAVRRTMITNIDGRRRETPGGNSLFPKAAGYIWLKRERKEDDDYESQLSVEELAKAISRD